MSYYLSFYHNYLWSLYSVLEYEIICEVNH